MRRLGLLLLLGPALLVQHSCAGGPFGRARLHAPLRAQMARSQEIVVEGRDTAIDGEQMADLQLAAVHGDAPVGANGASDERDVLLAAAEPLSRAFAPGLYVGREQIDNWLAEDGAALVAASSLVTVSAASARIS